MKKIPTIVGLLIAIAGCGSGPEGPTGFLVFDLTTQIDQAEIHTETGFIDIGSVDARRFLGSGWSWNERGKDGDSFAWGSRSASEIRFFLAGPKSLEVRFRCRPYRGEGRSVESVSLSLNGRSAGDVILHRGWREYSLTLPEDTLKSGVNLLVLEYQWTTTDFGTPRTKAGRQVAVAWDWIRFPQIESGKPPAATAPDTLRLTRGSRTDFFFEAPDSTVLVVDEIRIPEDGSRKLRASVLRQDESESELLPMNGAGSSTGARGARAWPLTSKAGLARLRFDAEGDVELVRPRIQTIGSPVPPAEGDEGVASSSVPRVRPSIVLLYVIDTLRADRISADGSHPDDASGLGRLVRDGVMFTDAQAQSSWTKPATASILTGQLPWAHGAQRSEDALSGKIPTLAQYLADLDFATAAFSANGNISPVFGFHHGFEHFSLMGKFDAPATRVQSDALQWLDDQESTREPFLYIHTIDPHAPYMPADRPYTTNKVEIVGSVPFMRRLAKSQHEPDPELIRTLAEMYDTEVSTSREVLTEMLDELEHRGLYEQALVVLVSDHGEEFYDHGQWTHGRNLHRATLQVPLLIKFPDNWAAGTRIAATAQQIDLLPTILDYLDQPTPPVPGISLLPFVQETADPSGSSDLEFFPRPVFASVHYHNNHWIGVVLGDWKLMLRDTERMDRQARLFNRSLDPEERQNLAPLHPVRVGYLTSLIRAEIERPRIQDASQPVELDDETRQRLEALGYLN